jgi:para-aminobenzoate synthetase component 1
VVSGALRECARLEWWLTDGEEPTAVLTSFLDQYGLTSPTAEYSVTLRESASFPDNGVTGAVVLLSAAACAAIAGVAPGAPTPAPAVPDLVAIVYAGGPRPGAQTPPDAGGRGWWLGEWEPSWSPSTHAMAVAAVRSAIARGDVYQCNLVGHASALYRGDPWPALRRITGLPGAAYPYLVSGQGWAVASASPETLVRVRGRRIETLPLKGTRPATRAGRAELRASAKERAEHVMIVDLERNDLAQVARVGSVSVPSLFAVRRWCDLWQAESRVCAELADGVDLAALLRALCPGGSVTGAPKLAALAQINALEPVGRGPSMGAVGWLDPYGLDLGLTIRTVAVDGERVHVWSGGGVTWDSDPEAEVAEAAAKAAPLMAALASSDEVGRRG